MADGSKISYWTFHVRAPFWWLYDGSSWEHRSTHEEKLVHCWNFKELSKLGSFRCDGTHEHDQSRGKALKLAENDTFKLTDMLHECFRVAARDQASKRKACSVKFACPVKMSDSRLAANPAGREAVLDEATRERNKRGWAHIHNRILYALVVRNQGEGTLGSDFVEGLMNEWSPASAVRFYGKDDPLVDVLKFCILPKEPELERVSPPEATPGYVIWILVSDSSCALITGRRHTLRKYGLAEHLKERKPGYVSEFIHEMMWGKTLRQLVKRGVELAADARARAMVMVPVSMAFVLVRKWARRGEWSRPESQLAIRWPKRPLADAPSWLWKTPGLVCQQS